MKGSDYEVNLTAFGRYLLIVSNFMSMASSKPIAIRRTTDDQWLCEGWESTLENEELESRIRTVQSTILLVKVCLRFADKGITSGFWPRAIKIVINTQQIHHVVQEQPEVWKPLYELGDDEIEQSIIDACACVRAGLAAFNDDECEAFGAMLFDMQMNGIYDVIRDAGFVRLFGSDYHQTSNTTH